MKTSDFDYNLPPELIAQEPASVRDKCRMLVMSRKSGSLEDHIFSDIENMLEPGDLLVANETRVMPARLLGKKRSSGGAAEVFLLRKHSQVAQANNTEALWDALVRPGKRLKPGSGAVVDFENKNGEVVLWAQVVDWAKTADKGERVVKLETNMPSLDEALHAVGHTPLPPYIKGYAGDEEMYQTVYSQHENSAAAPTAGLHFTPELISRLKAKGVLWATVDLEVGLDTFRIVDEADPVQHKMHTECYTVSQQTASMVNETKARGGRVIAVGTTSVRSLESAWQCSCSSADDTNACGSVLPCKRASTSLYLLPGSTFHVVDALITNFHVPKSTLLMLVSAFSSREHIMNAYKHAIEQKYRMLSFGDAMFIC